MASKLFQFQLPGSIIVPDGKQAGDTFQAMCTLRLNPNGTADLCQIDGESLPGYKDEDAERPAETPASSEDTDDATEPSEPNGNLLAERMMALGATQQGSA